MIPSRDKVNWLVYDGWNCRLGAFCPIVWARLSRVFVDHILQTRERRFVHHIVHRVEHDDCDDAEHCPERQRERPMLRGIIRDAKRGEDAVGNKRPEQIDDPRDVDEDPADKAVY